MITEVKSFQGKPTVFIDGKPCHGVFCSTLEDSMENFIDAGFEIFDTHPSIFTGWLGADCYDFSLTDRQIEGFLGKKKNALLILRFWMGYNGYRNGVYDFLEWWREKYPDEVSRLYDISAEGGYTFPSFASEKWRKQAGEALRRVIAYVESKYHDRIFAYVPGGGSCGEWFQSGAFDLSSNRNPQDYSLPMLKGFRSYLKDLYHQDINELNTAWNTHFDSFEEVMLPGPCERFGSLMGNLRDPLKERKLIDFYEYFNLTVADTLIDWGKIAKEACGRKKIILAFYGYLWVSSERHGQARSGHIHLKRILESPDIDGIVAPYMYDFRIVDGVVSSQTLAGTVRKHGKLLVNEADQSTSLRKAWPNPNHHPVNHEESNELTKRDMAYSLTSGIACWIMDLYNGGFNAPELIKGLELVRRQGETHWMEAGRRCSEIAVLLHEKASFYFREADPFLGPLFNMFKIWELERWVHPLTIF